MSTKALEASASHEEKQDNRPSPNDLVNFLPWACNQYQMEKSIVISKVVQQEYVSVANTNEKSKKSRILKQNASRHEVGSTNGKDKSIDGMPHVLNDHEVLRIVAITDVLGNIVELKFSKNNHIPRLLFKILTLVIKYQTYLTRITINSGIDQETMYEMTKLLNISNITEVSLDDTFFIQANYDILLEDTNKLRYLSLARCNIGDKVLENISKKLAYPLPASKLLIVLILSSNNITDIGIAHLAEALRTNRQLSYISLADNRLTDDGVCLILNTLTRFPLTQEEIITEKGRHMHYLKEKNNMINEMVKELRMGEYDKKTAKKKGVRPATVQTVKKGKLEKESSLKSLSVANSNPNFDTFFYSKAVDIVEDTLGEYKDPFCLSNTMVKDGTKYCQGNNAVSYLNLAYNNMSFLSLKKLLDVLMYQKLLDRRPRGLVNICVDGNDLPVSCKEMWEIDEILEMGFMSTDRRMSVHKKRPGSKNTPR